MNKVIRNTIVINPQVPSNRTRLKRRKPKKAQVSESRMSDPYQGTIEEYITLGQQPKRLHDKNNEGLKRYLNEIIVGWNKIPLSPKLVNSKADDKARTFKLTEEEQELQNVVINKLEQLAQNFKLISPNISAKNVNLKNYESNVNSV